MEDDFITAFTKYASRRTDAPLEYLIGCAFSLLSTVTARRCYVDMMHGRIYPNLWIVLYGDSSTRKSTAMDRAMEIFEGASCSARIRLPEDASPEALLEELAERGMKDGYSVGFFQRDEFGAWLASLEKNYNEDMKPLFNELYNCPEKRRKKLRGQQPFILQNVYITILTSVQPEVLMERTTATDVHSGWIPRFTFVKGEHNRRMPVRPMEEGDYRALSDLVTWFRSINDILNALEEPLEFALDPLALERYNAWMDDRDVVKKERIWREMLGKANTTVLKFAALHAIARKGFPRDVLDRINHGQLKFPITLDNMNRAIAYQERLDRWQHEVLSLCAATPEYKEKESIYKIIAERGKDGIMRAEILTQAKMTSKKLQDYLDTLVEEERVNMRKLQRAGMPGRRPWRYVVVDNPVETEAEKHDECSGTNHRSEGCDLNSSTGTPTGASSAPEPVIGPAPITGRDDRSVQGSEPGSGVAKTDCGTQPPRAWPDVDNGGSD